MHFSNFKLVHILSCLGCMSPKLKLVNLKCIKQPLVAFKPIYLFITGFVLIFGIFANLDLATWSSSLMYPSSLA